MNSARIIASGAISAAGSGREAFAVGPEGVRPASMVCTSDWLHRAGLRRPRAALVPALQRGGASVARDPKSR